MNDLQRYFVMHKGLLLCAMGTYVYVCVSVGVHAAGQSLLSVHEMYLYSTMV